uniref:Pepsinogen, putative n=1 Tax=Theileria annulata TaxID=5874 RepID=A0A3B0MH11_THEAN
MIKCIIIAIIIKLINTLPYCSDININKPCIYNGPIQKRIFVLKSLTPNENKTTEEINEENWHNVNKGFIHYLYRSSVTGSGPTASNGPDTSTNTTNNTTKDPTEASTVTDGKGANSTAMECNSSNIEEYPSGVGREPHSVTGKTKLINIKLHNSILIPHLRHVQYALNMGVGTPKQEINPIIDTGSTNTWVISQNCISNTCEGVASFNSKKSETFNPINEGLKIKFGTGIIKGVLGIDNITIGNDIIKQQIFGLVNEENSNIFNVIKFQGIIGLGFPKLAFDHHTSLYDNYSKQINADLIFSLYFSNQYSYLMMGGIDKRFYKGDLYMLPVIRELYWEIKLYELWIGNIKLCCNNESYIIFDSGTSFNTMPHTEFLLFKQYIKPKYCNGLENIYEEYPIIKYKLEGGIEINIEPQEYIFLHKDKCRIAYMQIDVPSSYGRAFILGTQAFMTHYYTVYQRQPPMVGFAKSVDPSELDPNIKSLINNF